MTIDLQELLRLGTAIALVATVALAVGLVAHALRPTGEPLLPRWKPFPVPWSGFEVAIAFVVVSFVVPVAVLQALDESGFYQLPDGDDFPNAKSEKAELDRLLAEINRLTGEAVKLEAAGQSASAERIAEDVNRLRNERAQFAEVVGLHATLRMLWASLLALPIPFGGLFLARYTLYRSWHPKPTGSVAGKVTLAVVAWCVIVPVVLLLNVLVNAVAQALGVPPDTHSLAKLSGRPLGDQILLGLEACIGAPLREEIIIRGVLLWWCVGRMKLPGAGVLPVTNMRPWFVMGAAALFAAASGKWQPVAFAGVLAVGLVVLWKYTRTGARRARAVYATAAFFALMHSVWPNPVPLFVLGLALGWLAVRTNGLLVPILVHSLFNAVSVVLVLRA